MSDLEDLKIIVQAMCGKVSFNHDIDSIVVDGIFISESPVLSGSCCDDCNNRIIHVIKDSYDVPVLLISGPEIYGLLNEMVGNLINIFDDYNLCCKSFNIEKYKSKIFDEFSSDSGKSKKEFVNLSISEIKEQINEGNMSPELVYRYEINKDNPRKTLIKWLEKKLNEN